MNLVPVDILEHQAMQASSQKCQVESKSEVEFLGHLFPYKDLNLLRCGRMFDCSVFDISIISKVIFSDRV